MKLVYISGPYSSDPVAGTRAAIEAQARLRGAGILSIVPHLSLLAELVAPAGYRAWMDLDLELVARCDAVLRLPGESPGSDAEVVEAQRKGLPVFDDLDAAVAWGRGR